LSFALISAMGILVTTAFYVEFTRIATRLTIMNAHAGGLGIPLTCQFAAILVGASTSYVLNGAFTWPRAQSKAAADLAQVQEI
jgi:putative flippase GtrA